MRWPFPPNVPTPQFPWLPYQGPPAPPLPGRLITWPYLIGRTAFADGNAVATVTPDLTALTLQTNDIILANASLVGSVSSNDFVTPPAGEGWATADSVVVAVGTNVHLTVFWKRWGSGATDSLVPVFTQNGTITAGFSVECTVWRGCRTTSLPYDSAVALASTVGNPVDSPDAVSLGPFRTSVRAYAASIAAGSYTLSSEGTILYTGTAFSQTAGPDRAIAGSYLVQELAGNVGQAFMSMTGTPNNAAGATVVLAPVGASDVFVTRRRRPILGVGR